MIPHHRTPGFTAALELLRFSFQIGLVTSTGFYLLDSIFPLAVAPFLPLGILVTVTVALGIASALFADNRPPSTPELIRPASRSGIVSLVLVGFVAAIILWNQLRDLGLTAVPMTLLSTAAVVVLAWFLITDPAGDRNGDELDGK